MKFKVGHIGWNKGMNLSQEHKDKISKSMSGKPSIMKGRTKENGLYPKRCGFQLGHKKYAGRDFRKGEHMGKDNFMFSKPDIVRNNSNRELYKDTYFRSGWEVKYAKWLDSKNIKWEYEKDTFKLKDTTYTPDFYLPEQNIYVEIKGFMHAEAYFKIEEFILNNPNINYMLMTRKDLEKEGIL